MSKYDQKEKRTPVIYAAIFFLLVMGIVATGYVSYRNFEGQFRLQAERQISAIAELKVHGLVNWREERLSDAEFLYRNPDFSALVERYFENPNDVDVRTQLLAWLENYQDYDQYESAYLLDVTGAKKISVPDAPDTDDARSVREAAIASLSSGRSVFLDFQRDTSAGGEISILAPIFTEQGNRPLGVLVLSIDPQIYLYPYIQSWPINSESAETLIVRRDGDRVLFLNELRFVHNAALTLSLPLTDTDTPAVKAALGQTGIMEGIDYRGEPVLADVRAVPDSPWFLIAKMDIAEAYAPLRERLWQTLLIIGMAIFAAGAGLALVWRQGRMNFYRAQVEAAGALRESEEKFRSLFNNSEVGMFITRLDGSEILEFNEKYLNILGYTFEEVKGKPSKNLWADKGERERMVQLLQAEGRVTDYECDILTKYGEVRRCISSLRLYRDTGILEGSIHDITERKRAEEALKKSEIWFRSLFENASDGIFYLSTDRELVEVNHAFALMHGYSIDEMRKMNLRDLDVPETAEKAPERMRRILSGEVFTFEVEHYHKDGHILPLEVTASMITVNNEKYVLAFHRDITERKRAENALRESEDKFKYVFDYSVVGKSITYLGGEVHVNKAFCNMLDYSAEEMQGKKWQEMTHPDDIELTQNQINLLMSGEKESARLIKRFLRKNGSIVWVDLSSTLRRDKQNKPLYLMSAVIDITERKQAEEKLTEQLDELRRWHKAILGREKRILDLKGEVNDLLAQTGKPPRYASASNADSSGALS